MSTDYFGALLRSAGRPVDGVAPVHAPASPGADLVEIDAEHEAQRPGPGIPAAQKQQPAAPLRKATASAAAPVDGHRRPEAPAPEVPAGRHGARPAAPEVIDLSPPPLHSAVQAALAWVASDPRGRGDADAMQEVLAESTGVRAEAPMNNTEAVAQETDAATPLRGDNDNDNDNDNGDGDGPPPSPGPVTGHRPATTPAADRRMRGARALAPPPREEAIEITIGAIHLHVDAPPQAGIAPAPAPPPAAPSLRSPTPRSALSRRALYRL